MYRDKVLKRRIASIVFLCLILIITLNAYRNIRDSRADETSYTQERVVYFDAKFENSENSEEIITQKICATDNFDGTYSILLPTNLENEEIESYSLLDETIITVSSKTENIAVLVDEDLIFGSNIELTYTPKEKSSEKVENNEESQNEKIEEKNSYIQSENYNIFNIEQDVANEKIEFYVEKRATDIEITDVESEKNEEDDIEANLDTDENAKKKDSIKKDDRIENTEEENNDKNENTIKNEIDKFTKSGEDNSFQKINAFADNEKIDSDKIYIENEKEYSKVAIDGVCSKNVNKLTIAIDGEEVVLFNMLKNVDKDEKVFLKTSIEKNDIEKIIFEDNLENAPEDAEDVSALEDGSIKTWIDDNGIVTIASSGIINSNYDASYMFASIDAEIENLNILNTFTSVNMDYMFYNFGKSNVVNLEFGDNFNTSNVQTMRGMFKECGKTSLEKLIFSKKFNTENVTDSTEMFKECGINALSELDFGSECSFENVINSTEMFENCGKNSETKISISSKNFISENLINIGTKNLELYNAKAEMKYGIKWNIELIEDEENIENTEKNNDEIKFKATIELNNVKIRKNSFSEDKVKVYFDDELSENVIKKIEQDEEENYIITISNFEERFFLSSQKYKNYSGNVKIEIDESAIIDENGNGSLKGNSKEKFVDLVNPVIQIKNTEYDDKICKVTCTATDKFFKQSLISAETINVLIDGEEIDRNKIEIMLSKNSIDDDVNGELRSIGEEIIVELFEKEENAIPNNSIVTIAIGSGLVIDESENTNITSLLSTIVEKKQQVNVYNEEDTLLKEDNDNKENQDYNSNVENIVIVETPEIQKNFDSEVNINSHVARVNIKITGLDGINTDDELLKSEIVIIKDDEIINDKITVEIIDKTEVENGYEYNIELQGEAIGYSMNQLKLRILPNAIHNVSGIGNAKTDIFIYNVLALTENEKNEESYFFGNTKIQRKYVNKITFKHGISDANDTKWDISAQKDESIYAWYNLTSSGMYDISIASVDGYKIDANENSSYLFEGIGYDEKCTDETVIYGLENVNFENVINMSHMFEKCGFAKMNELTLPSNFEIHNVIDMTNMFKECGFSSMQKLDLGSNFTKIASSNTGIFEECGTSDCKIYCGEAIFKELTSSLKKIDGYKTSKVFRINAFSDETISVDSERNICCKYYTQLYVTSIVRNNDEKSIELKIQGKGINTSYALNNLQADDFELKVGSNEEYLQSSKTLTESVPDSDYGFAYILTYKNIGEISGDISLTVQKRVVLDNANSLEIYQNGNFSDVKFLDEVNAHIDYIKPVIIYKSVDTSGLRKNNGTEKTVTMKIEITDEYYNSCVLDNYIEQSHKLSELADIFDIVFGGYEEDLTVEISKGEKLNSVEYIIQFSGFDNEKCKYNGNVQIVFYSGIAFDNSPDGIFFNSEVDSPNTNIVTSISVCEENIEYENDGLVVDNAKPTWEISNVNIDEKSTTVSVDIIGTDKNYMENSLTVDDIEIYIDDLFVNSSGEENKNYIKKVLSSETSIVTKNDESEEKVHGIKYTLTLSNFEEEDRENGLYKNNSGNVKIKIASGTIEDRYQNFNDETIRSLGFVDFIKPEVYIVSSTVEEDSENLDESTKTIVFDVVDKYFSGTNVDQIEESKYKNIDIYIDGELAECSVNPDDYKNKIIENLTSVDLIEVVNGEEKVYGKRYTLILSKFYNSRDKIDYSREYAGWSGSVSIKVNL